MIVLSMVSGGWGTWRYPRRPALPGLTQPVNAARLWGRAGRAGERRFLGARREGRRCPCFPVGFDPLGAVGFDPVGGTTAPEVVSVPPPVPLALEGQLDVVMVLVSMVTAPSRASSLPWIVAPVFAVMDAKAMMVPTKRVPVPSVAEEPTCQKTLQACAPPASRTLVLEPVISVEPIWKMNTALGSPWASSVTLPDDSSNELPAV
jgi:hypothetical protein